MNVEAVPDDRRLPAGGPQYPQFHGEWRITRGLIPQRLRRDKVLRQETALEARRIQTQRTANGGRRNIEEGNTPEKFLFLRNYSTLLLVS
jgi:hypothetical protein